MDLKEYRRRVEQEVSVPRSPPKRSAPISMASNPAVATFSLEAPRPIRVDPPPPDPLLDDLDRVVPALLHRLKSPRLSPKTRLAALHQLAAATFLGERFAPHLADYLEVMRYLTTERSTPPELRAAAISILAGERDPAAQKRLKDGLLDPATALVPAATALSLLSLDDHSNVGEVARTVFERASDDQTREAALRALATDPAAVDLLVAVAGDKSEARDVRAMGSAALRCLDPEKFSELARGIILDDDDYDDIRAASVGAFANQPELHAQTADAELLEKIEALAADGTNSDLGVAAKRLVTNIAVRPDVRFK